MSALGYLEQLCLEAYDRITGLDLTDVCADGGIVKAPCGGEAAGKSPEDRGKKGTKRSVLVDGSGLPLGCVAAPANCHDSPLLRPTLERLGRFADHLGRGIGVGLPEQITVHLDAGYDSGTTRDLIDELGCQAVNSPTAHPCRPADAGRSSAPTPGTTAASRNSPSAPNAAPA